MGVLIEVNSETDFVARNEDFRAFVKDIAMHIAAAAPVAVNRDGVDPDFIAHERKLFTEQMEESGKPANIIEQIVNGKIDKYYKEHCLMEQPYVKDTEKTIEEFIIEKRSTIGENIVVRRFARFKLGEGL